MIVAVSPEMVGLSILVTLILALAALRASSVNSLRWSLGTPGSTILVASEAFPSDRSVK